MCFHGLGGFGHVFVLSGLLDYKDVLRKKTDPNNEQPVEIGQVHLFWGSMSLNKCKKQVAMGETSKLLGTTALGNVSS